MNYIVSILLVICACSAVPIDVADKKQDLFFERYNAGDDNKNIVIDIKGPVLFRGSIRFPESSCESLTIRSTGPSPVVFKGANHKLPQSGNITLSGLTFDMNNSKEFLFESMNLTRFRMENCLVYDAGHAIFHFRADDEFYFENCTFDGGGDTQYFGVIDGWDQKIITKDSDLQFKTDQMLDEMSDEEVELIFEEIEDEI